MLTRSRPLAGVVVALVPLLLTIGVMPRSMLGGLFGSSEGDSCCVLGACCCSMLDAACACDPASVPGVDRPFGDESLAVGEDSERDGVNLAALRCSQTVRMIVSLGLAGVAPARPTEVVFAERSERTFVVAAVSVEPRAVEIPTPPPRG